MLYMNNAKLNNKNNLMDKTSGITIIALVITIIVLLILSSVTVSLVINSGIIQKAQNAIENNKYAQEEENVKLAVISAKIAGNGDITTDSLNEELNKYFNNDEKVKEIKQGWTYKIYKILKNGKVEKLLVLPDEYQRVEYIQSTGGQYIDTGVICSQDMSCEIENTFDKLINKQLFGVYQDPRRTHYGIVNAEIYMPTVENDFTTEHIFNIDNNYHTFFLSSSIYKYDDITIATGEFQFANDLTFYLFARNNNGVVDDRCASKLTKAKFWYGDKLIRDFIPCYRKSDGVIGLYDLVEDKFYTGDKFLKGNDV